MLTAEFSRFLGEAMNSAVTTAGVCGIASIADPKAAALGALAASVAGYAFTFVFGQALVTTSVVFAVGRIVTKLLVGGMAGKYFDEEFNYVNMSISYLCAVAVTSAAVSLLGIDGLRLW